MFSVPSPNDVVDLPTHIETYLGSGRRSNFNRQRPVRFLRQSHSAIGEASLLDSVKQSLCVAHFPLEILFRHVISPARGAFLRIYRVYFL
jgi:hypothetical protein